MMKSDGILALLTKIAFGAASAAVIGGGTAVIRNSSTLAVHEVRITSLEQDRVTMRDLSAKLDETNRNVAVLNERLDHEVKR